MGNMCWEQNPKCFVKGLKHGESACPAYNEKKGCWQMDWSFIISSLPDEEKARWKKIMKGDCPSCPVLPHTKTNLPLSFNWSSPCNETQAAGNIRPLHLLNAV